MLDLFKDLFTFSRKDRNGLLVLMFILLIITSAYIAVPYFSVKETADFSVFQKEIAQLKAQQQQAPEYIAEETDADGKSRFQDREPAAGKNHGEYEKDGSITKNDNPNTSIEPFPFDPNTLSFEEAKMLGLSDKVARTLQNYLKKGGKFRKKEDFKRVYGLSEKDYQRLEAYIDIPDKKNKTMFADNKNKKPDTKKQAKTSFGSGANTENKKDIVLHKFDPNTLSFDEAKKLGLSDKVARTLQNYVKKGGKFYKKEDFKKVYGLSDADYQRLFPYIDINKAQFEKKDGKEQLVADASQQKGEKPMTFSMSNEPLKIDINAATIEDWKKISGIGDKHAGRIVRFREALGGFTNIEQVGETYYLDALLFLKIKEHLVNNRPELIKKININKAAEADLAGHPYVNEKVAKSIVKYRSSKGDFTNLDQLIKVRGMNDMLLQKLKPYISVK